MVDSFQERIFLLEKEFGNEIFLDSFLRKVNKFPPKSKISVDISDFSWANDFQLSSLPFVFSHLKHKKGIDLVIEFPQKSLFEKNDFFSYLYSSGFFKFVENYGLTLNKGNIKIDEYIDIKDELIKFQSFKNIAFKDDESELNESQKLLYDLSSNLRALFQKDIFDYSTAAENLARVIAKELIENINQHSGADLALVRCKYITDFKEIQRIYGNTNLCKEFLDNHRHSNIFVLTISDNGRGIIQSLKEKYKNGKFIVDEKSNLKEIIDHSNSWWIKKAFETHMLSETNVRSRLGLKVVLDTICEYNGFLYLRSADAAACYNRYNGKPTDIAAHFPNPEISGTHYVIILPAEYKKKLSFSDCVLYRKDSVETAKEERMLRYEEFDISYYRSAITTSIEVSYKYPKKIIDNLSIKIELALKDKNRIIAIDFSNAINEKANDYAFILQAIIEKYRDNVGRFCILRNVSDYIISVFRKKSILPSLLSKYRTFLSVFNTSDRFSVLGILDSTVEEDLIKLFRNMILNINQLRTATVELIKNNDFIVKTAISENSEEVAYFVDFYEIFMSEFKQKVTEEIKRAKALITGHFSININTHVDNYLIAPFIFQNPIICRMFAKEIIKQIHNRIPDVLLTYSTTGIIMYWYLKNYYIPGLKLMLVSSPTDLSLAYGQLAEKNQSVLILIDIKNTGDFIDKLRNLAIDLTGSSENIIAQIAIFDLNKNVKNEHYDVKSLYDELIVSVYQSVLCPCRSDKMLYSKFGTALKIDSTTGVPTIYQKETSNLSVLLRKKELIKETKENKNDKVKHKEFRSLIDDDKLNEFGLIRYWKFLENVFQIDHVERGDTHFRHYDIPERLLFKDKTLIELETYIKHYTWSFNREVHYIIYPQDLTAAFLSHIVASRFLKKPEVVAARKFGDGSIVLPASISENLKGKNVLLVDDAINTGSTLLELIGLINIYGGIVAGIFTITSRTTPEVEMTLGNLVPKVACAYRFHLDVFKKKGCDLCTTEKMLIKKLEAAATKEFFTHLKMKIELNKVKQYESR